MRHPREMVVADMEAFLSMRANERKVSASTHNQALSAVLFMCCEELDIDLPWLNNIGRPQQTKRIPAVLTKDEVAGLFA
jgi:site-specific recombinase XerD